MILCFHYELSFEFNIKNGTSDSNFWLILNSLIEKNFVIHDFEWCKAFAYETISEILIETIASNNLVKKSIIDAKQKPLICLESDGQYILPQNKWYFNNYDKLIEKFNIKLIECKPKKLELDDLKRTVYSNYLLDKALTNVNLSAQNRKKELYNQLLNMNILKEKIILLINV